MWWLGFPGGGGCVRTVVVPFLGGSTWLVDVVSVSCVRCFGSEGGPLVKIWLGGGAFLAGGCLQRPGTFPGPLASPVVGRSLLMPPLRGRGRAIIVPVGPSFNPVAVVSVNVPRCDACARGLGWERRKKA